MMRSLGTIGLLGLACVGLRAGEGLAPAVQARLDAQVKVVQGWAADPVLIQAVQAHNSRAATEGAGMTQEKWKSLTVLDPLVRAFTRNEAASFLKHNQTEMISEAFLSGSDGSKVAFLAKTTNWSHQGKPKHEFPMKGEIWQGPVEVDESTGVQQVQVSVPIQMGGKPIGSLVVGFVLSKLLKD
jgi:hypothetical protein